MIFLDIINASFEFISGFMVLLHCRQVLKDKQVAGVNVYSVAFFTIWGLWNLYYYPQLGQILSAIGGIMICLANAWWVYLILKYRKKDT